MTDGLDWFRRAQQWLLIAARRVRTMASPDMHTIVTCQALEQRIMFDANGQLIGIDFDQPGNASPDNWTPITSGSSGQFIENLIDESGGPTDVDITLSTFGTDDVSADASSVPIHTQSLTNIGGTLFNDSPVTITFDELSPLGLFEVYVFALDRFGSTQNVELAGDGNATDFQQNVPKDILHVNREQGSSARELGTFAELITSSASGQITITVSPDGDSDEVVLAGIAIRQIGAVSGFGDIEGFKFEDQNLSGNHDNGEPGVSGVTIFLDINDNGVPDGPEESNTFSSGDVSRNIPDGGTLNDSQNVSGFTSTITDVNVTVNIDHTFVDDLELSLIAPNGTTVLLVSEEGDDGDGFTNTTLSDEAGIEIVDADPPFTGAFSPEGRLSDFDTRDANGVWTLRVRDLIFSETGTLQNWSLDITAGEGNGEPITQTRSGGQRGEFDFQDVLAGTYAVREVVPDGQVQTFPAGDNNAHFVSVLPNQTVREVDFGNAPSTNNPAITIDDASIDEGDSGVTSLTFGVHLAAPTAQVVTVRYTTIEGNAQDETGDNDYAAVTEFIIFDPGQVTQTAVVPINGDTAFEPDELFFVALTNATNAVLIGAGADNQAIGTITNDDPQVMVSIADLTITEGDAGTTDALFAVSLSAPTSDQVVIEYITVADSSEDAAGDDDFLFVNDFVTFGPGQTMQTAAVTIVGDEKREPDEIFFVDIVSAGNAAIDDARAVGTILNDDSIPTIAIADVSMPEGDTVTTDFDFTVTLSNPTVEQVTVQFATSDGSAQSGQTAGDDNDFVALSGTATIAPLATQTVITVAVNGDVEFEFDEQFFIDLSGPGNAAIDDSRGVGTIEFDDGPFQIVSASDDVLRTLPGESFGFDLLYDISNGDTTVDGLDVRVHFDSSALELEFPGLEDVLLFGLLNESVEDDGTADGGFDGDASTDKFIQLRWNRPGDDWPGEGQSLPVSLAHVPFSVIGTAGTSIAGLTPGESTQVNFTVASTPPGIGFVGQPLTVQARPPVDLDVDDSGESQALTDGLLIIRFLAGFTGQALVQDAIDTASAQRTDPQEIVDFLELALDTMLNVDDDPTGAAALTDGLMIIRFLAGFRGQALVADAVAPQALRTDTVAIESFLADFLPPAPAANATQSQLDRAHLAQWRASTVRTNDDDTLVMPLIEILRGL